MAQLVKRLTAGEMELVGWNISLAEVVSFVFKERLCLSRSGRECIYTEGTVNNWPSMKMKRSNEILKQNLFHLSYAN